MNTVTADSTDEAILKAIDERGEKFKNPPRRWHDWPDEERGETRAWILPHEIGTSTKRDQRLVKRLYALVNTGKLEVKLYSRMSRFRVIHTK